MKPTTVFAVIAAAAAAPLLLATRDVPAQAEHAATLTSAPPTNGGQRGDAATPEEQVNRIRIELDPLCWQVNQELALDVGKAPRADLLVMYGRSAAASGRFDVSAAAYALFLSEFGTQHAHSPQAAQRLADGLAPLDLTSSEVLLTADGPQYRPAWRMQREPPPDRLRLAVSAYELAADIAREPQAAEKALLSIGWVYRSLNDWSASTAAWNRCAAAARQSRIKAEAIWLAAENLAWLERPAEAAERLRAFITASPEDTRLADAKNRIESLEAESRRSLSAAESPVAALQAEIALRAKARPAYEVYASYVDWLGRRGRRAKVISVSRWATMQADWPLNARLRCHCDLADALLQQPETTTEAKLEAAAVLDRIASITEGEDWVIPAMLRRCRLLTELGRLDAAEQTIGTLETRTEVSPIWKPRIICERLRLLLAKDDLPAAQRLCDQLLRSSPDYELPADLTKALADTKTGGGR